jgi:hypothetical protein
MKIKLIKHRLEIMKYTTPLPLLWVQGTPIDTKNILAYVGIYMFSSTGQQNIIQDGGGTR